ncbi:MAG: A/G-specific adenine glycosylase [Acidobacteriota bacterium]|jgi:A/G-specific adenine glycosylase
MLRPGGLLLRWFETHQRQLPWRTPFPRDPYLVLLSEVMLQQTQVQRVAPLFRGFVEKFPTLAALAEAAEAEVLAAWSGLGYYRRARALHATARAVQAAGAWPHTREELQALPGLGPYTAAALAAFSFGGSDPPVDGNVTRVAARVLALDAPTGSVRLRREAERWARALHRDAPTPATFEALMELGARICRPRGPSCGHCPLAATCVAHASDAADRYPLPRPRRQRQAHRWAALWLVRRDGRVLLHRRDEGQFLGGLWLPPIRELVDSQEPETAAAALLHSLGLGVQLTPVEPLAHSITHRGITVFPFAARCDLPTVSETCDLQWCIAENPGVATSSLTHKLRLVCSPRLAEPGPPAGYPPG